MNKRLIRRAVEFTASTVVILSATGTAHGQTRPVAGVAIATAEPEAQPAAETQSVPARTDAAGPSDIIVTARKRQESILQVPVVMTAISGAQLDHAQITQITDLPRLVPG